MHLLLFPFGRSEREVRIESFVSARDVPKIERLSRFGSKNVSAHEIRYRSSHETRREERRGYFRLTRPSFVVMPRPSNALSLVCLLTPSICSYKTVTSPPSANTDEIVLLNVLLDEVDSASEASSSCSPPPPTRGSSPSPSPSPSSLLE